MIAPWVKEELATSNLKDKRLDKLFGQLVTSWSERPRASIPAACGGNAEMTAAYRFCDNEKVSLPQLLAPHREATLLRVAAQECVVLAQDTTELDLTRPDMLVEGVGPLTDETRVGAFLHVMHAFARNGTALGTVHAETWTRAFSHTPVEERRTPAYRAAKKQAQKEKPIWEKESFRWVEFLTNAHAVARATPDTHVICVADSEADIFEMFEAGQLPTKGPRADWIVRACQDRALQKPEHNAPDEELQSHQEASLLTARVAATESRYTAVLNVRGRKQKIKCDKRGRRQPRESRVATVEVRATRVTLRPPPRPDGQLSPLTLNAVLVREVNPPPKDEPVEWLLLTSLPIDTAEQVREVIACYSLRWMIEIFFRTLKSGCRVEERRFEKLPRLLNCLTIYLIVAWRTLYVCHLARSCPDVSCEVVFEPAEWKSVYRVIHREPPPLEPPKLKEMVRLVAQLGGYVNKPDADDPGPQTVWLGLARTHDFALCWQLFGPEAKKPN
jgi:hypothetical protein